MYLTEDTPTVLSLGKLCEEIGYDYHWTSGQKQHFIKNSERCTIHCPWFIDEFLRLHPNLLLLHLHRRIL